MLAKRVIPCLDVRDGRVVKGVNFVGLRDAGDPIELAELYDRQRADEVVFLDITATSDKRATAQELASRASESLRLPYCVGGGFRSVADMRSMIAAGADKVSVNSAAVADPDLISRAAAAFGSQAVVVAIDAKSVAGNPDRWEVYVAGGRKATGIDAVAWAAKAASLGAGEILLTSMDRDGSREGFDCALTRAVARAVDIPVIASGGVGCLEHFAQGVLEGEADAVLAASVFHFGEFTVEQVKRSMASFGIPCACEGSAKDAVFFLAAAQGLRYYGCVDSRKPLSEHDTNGSSDGECHPSFHIRKSQRVSVRADSAR